MSYSFLHFKFFLVPLLGSLAFAECPAEDKPAMLAIEAAMNLTGAPPAHTCCRAAIRSHISCDVSNGRVVGLELDASTVSVKDNRFPAQICDLRMLRSLKLVTFSSDKIPDCLHRLRQLKRLLIDGNGRNEASSALSGIMTRKQYQLQEVIIHHANLKGTELKNISNLGGLRILRLLRTRLSTSIPHAICSLKRLSRLELLENKLTGEIPACVAALERLTSLDLRRNRLHGRIPELGSTLKRLDMLDLSQNQLSGPFPVSLCNVSSLGTLYLNNNQLSSVLPECLSQIRSFRLGRNNFHGSLPLSLFSENSTTERIDVSFNRLTGPLPIISGRAPVSLLSLSGNELGGTINSHNWSLLSTLTWLDLSRNRLTGVLPPALGRLATLILVDVSGNELEGFIPASFGNLEGLQYFLASDNRLEGDVPETLANCGQLILLTLTNNRLSGRISWIHQLGSLQVLQLGSNSFTGTISRFGQSLFGIDISRNKFEGDIPEFSRSGFYFRDPRNRIPVPIFNLSELRAIRVYNEMLFRSAFMDISDNRFNGTIPDSFENYTSLGYLNMSHNRLVGGIPESIGQLENLKTLDLSSNRLSGTIPWSLTRMYRLSYFNVSDNELSGSIPTGGQLNTFMAESYAGNGELCGLPLVRVCSRLSTSPGGGGEVTVVRQRKLGHFVVALGLAAACCITGGILVSSCIRGSRAARESSNMFQSELRLATGGFNEDNVIGRGGSSTIYKGVLRDGKPVAVKVFNPRTEASSRQFLQELNILGKVRHRNLVRVLNCCVDPPFMALVLELMEHGSLEMQLHERSQERKLVWRTRLRIALGVASALRYLHEEADGVYIVHGDVKPSNIFLDSQMEARLGDFGVARHSKFDKLETSSLTGSIGYVPPEFGLNGKMTTAGDVYSFGVVLLEMLTGLRPTDRLFTESTSMRDWILSRLGESYLEKTLQEERRESSEVKVSVETVTKVALLCSHPSCQARPTMKQVAHVLTAAYMSLSSSNVSQSQ